MESIDQLPPKEIWGMIEQRLKSDKAPYDGLTATYEFQLIDETDGLYQLAFSNDTATVHYGHEQEPDCVLKMKEKHFKKFPLGKLNSTTAFMTGKIKIDGNISLALKLENMLKQYPFAAEQ